MKYLTEHYFERCKRLQELYWKNYNEVLVKYPEDKYGSDLRPALFGLPGNTLVGYVIALAMIETTLKRKDWWSVYTPYKTESEIIERYNHFDMSIRNSFFILFFSKIEWIIRNMLVVLDSEACDGGFANFESVHKVFFKKIGCESLTTLFDISRDLRNSIHDNGKFCNKKHKDSQEYLYRGQKIKFFHGKTIEGATSLSFDLMEDLILGCRDIVNTRIICSLPSMTFVI